ncbi:MAG: hypothetical protein HY815_09835 [Candidatus Riflebacteria bacterium]|nr:hypothetical protein [Candidatus Riflebacteria bacterium]
MDQRPDPALVPRCPVCHDALASRSTRTCPACETAIHEDCGDYIGGCARFACELAATPRTRIVELLRARHQVDEYGSKGCVAFLCMVLLEVSVYASLSPVAVAAGVALAWAIVSGWRNRRRARSWLSGPVPWNRLLSLFDASAREERTLAGQLAGPLIVAIGVVYVAVRVLWWRGPVPVAAGLVFGLGCVLYAWFLGSASRLQEKLSGLASQWRDEIEALAIASDPAKKAQVDLLAGKVCKDPDRQLIEPADRRQPRTGS